MKKALKIFGLGFLGIFLFLSIYFLVAFVLGRMGTGEEKGTKDELSIYILTNGVHTDLVLPIKTEQIDWSEKIKFENTKGKQTDYQYLAVGWGDKGFYLDTPTWAELKFSTAFRAAFGLSSAAIHATYYRRMKEGEDCVKINISKDQYQRLINFIKKSLLVQSNGEFIPIATNANYGDSDAFYDAKGSYSLFHTCNGWTNDALKVSGQKASVWTPFDSGIFYQYQE